MDSTRSVRSMESRDTSQSRTRTGGGGGGGVGGDEGLRSESFQSLAVSSTEKKVTHSEIEKRRRQKMNKYMNELVNHLPVNKTRKLDKITMLKLALQHMKNLKASSSLLSDSFLCQKYITPFELQNLVLRDMDDFMLVVKCDTNKILYASESCSHNIASPNELVDRVFFELVHPSDTKYVKEHLAFSDISNTSGTISSFIINKSKAYSTGERRSFVCRIKSEVSNKRMSSSASSSNVNNNSQFSDFKKIDYKVVNFVGYIRSDLGSNLKYSESFSQQQQQPQQAVGGFTPSPPTTSTSSSGYQSSAKISQMLSSNNSSTMGTNSNSNSNSSDMNMNSMLSTTTTSQHHHHAHQQQHHPATFPYKFANNHSMSLLNESMSGGGGSLNTSDNVGPNISILNESFNDLNTSQTSISNNNSGGIIMSSPHTSSGMNHHPGGGPSSSSSNSGHSTIYYIILHGQIKPKSSSSSSADSDSSLNKFVTKYDSDGKFIYLEPEIYSLVGFLPHQLMSESLFNFVHPEDVANVRAAFEESIKSESHKAKSVEYRFKADQSAAVAAESSGYLKMETVFYALHNPFNGHYEHTVAQNRLVTLPSSSTTPQSFIKSNIVNNQYFNNFSQPTVSSQLSWAPLTPSPEDCKEAAPSANQYAMGSGDKSSTQSYKQHSSLSSSSSLHPMPVMHQQQHQHQHQQQQPQSILIDNNNYGVLQYQPSIPKSNSLNNSYHQLQTYNSAYHHQQQQQQHQPVPLLPPPSSQLSNQMIETNNKSLQMESSSGGCHSVVHQSVIQLPIYVPSHQSIGGGSNLFHVPTSNNSSNYIVSASEIKSEYDLELPGTSPLSSSTGQRFNNNSFELQQQQQHQQQINSNNQQRHFPMPYMTNRGGGGGDNNLNQMNVVWTQDSSISKNNLNNNN